MKINPVGIQLLKTYISGYKCDGKLDEFIACENGVHPNPQTSTVLGRLT